MENWLSTWTYSSNKAFSVKILLLNLLISQRLTGTYNSANAEIKVNAALSYKLDASKLQLDHLEANIIPEGATIGYYSSSDIDKRQKDVNGYLGNFMILDAADNNQKNNVPLCKAMDYYKGIETSWLVNDIKLMIADTLYFDATNNTPKEEFFKERTKRLKKYFKAFLDKKLEDEKFSVIF